MTQQLPESVSELSAVSESASPPRMAVLENSTQTVPFPGWRWQEWRWVLGWCVTAALWGVEGAFSAGETPVLTWCVTTCPCGSGWRVSPAPSRAVPQSGGKNPSRVLIQVLPGSKFKRELSYYKSKPSPLSILGNSHFFHFSSVLHACPRWLFVIQYTPPTPMSCLFLCCSRTPIITIPLPFSYPLSRKALLRPQKWSALGPPCSSLLRTELLSHSSRLIPNNRNCCGCQRLPFPGTPDRVLPATSSSRGWQRNGQEVTKAVCLNCLNWLTPKSESD